MSQTGVVKKPFPYFADGVTMQQLKEGQVMAFPDRIFDGLKAAGYIAASKGEPENSVAEATERDVTDELIDIQLVGLSDQELKDIIARSGTPVSGNLVHAVMVEQARAQLKREAAGKEPATGVDPNSGVTEQPLARPGEAPAPATVAQIETAAQTKAPANTSKKGGRRR